MAIARARLVDLSVARWYHCISWCVRQAFLLGEGPFNRKAWIESRLEELAQIFAVTVGGFSVLENHLHVLLGLDQDIASAWSDEDVVSALGPAVSCATKLAAYCRCLINGFEIGWPTRHGWQPLVHS